MVACARHSGIGEGANRTKLKKKPAFSSECVEQVIIAIEQYFLIWNSEI